MTGKGFLMENKKIKGMGFHHIALKAADIEKSTKFYEALGMTFIVGWGVGEKEIRMFDFGDGGRLELFAGGGDEYPECGKYTHFALCVENVEEAYRIAVEAGGEPLTPPKVVPLDSHPEKIAINIAFVKGPDGEQVEFFRQVP